MLNKSIKIPIIITILLSFTTNVVLAEGMNPNLNLSPEETKRIEEIEIYKQQKRDKEALVASVLTGILPGAGHVYLEKHSYPIEFKEACLVCFSTYVLLTSYYALINNDSLLSGNLSFVLVTLPFYLPIQICNIKNVRNIVKNDNMDSFRLTMNKIYWGSLGCVYGLPIGAIVLMILTSLRGGGYDMNRFTLTMLCETISIAATRQIYKQGNRYNEQGSFLATLVGGCVPTLVYCLCLKHDTVVDEGSGNSYQGAMIISVIGGLVGYNLSRKNPISKHTQQKETNLSLPRIYFTKGCSSRNDLIVNIRLLELNF